MWIVVLVLLLLGAQMNLTALVPLLPGDKPAPWWVGGRLLWPFAVESQALLPFADSLREFAPLIGIVSGTLFLMAAAALLRWVVPQSWFKWLIVGGALLSIVLQLVWFSGWAVFPILVDIVLLWAVFGQQITVSGLRE